MPEHTVLTPTHYGVLVDALNAYDAPELYFGEDSSKPSDYRRELADEVIARINRRVQRNGMNAMSIALDEEEYRVCVEALQQYSGEGTESIVDTVTENLEYYAGGN